MGLTTKLENRLKEHQKIYTMVELEKLILDLHKEFNCDIEKIQKKICKYIVITYNKIRIDITCNNDINYSDLKKQMKNPFPRIKVKEMKEEQKEETKPIKQSNLKTYKHPTEKIKYIKKQDILFGPFGTQWCHDEQCDDILDEQTKGISKIVEKLMKIEYPEQRSKEWFDLRESRVTASDGGCVIGVNHYELPYKFLMKKVLKPPFQTNSACYHGTKLEQIATMIYSYRMNVQVEEFGLIAHPKYSFLAASPDGIVGKYKLDGKTLTKYVGRMLEIKCPVTRNINTTGEIYGTICPEYYWVQVQLQLECCDLKECDFWQCNITEYDSRNDFIEDTNESEPYLSKETGFEKGCLIQLLPKHRYMDIKNGTVEYETVLYGESKFLYPPKIEMSPFDCDMFIAESIANFEDVCKKGGIKHPEDYCIDKVIYWKLNKSHNVTIERDKEWFKKILKTIEKMWKYVEFFRKNEEKSKIFFDYINGLELEKKKLSHDKRHKYNDEIMELAEHIYNEPNIEDKNAIKKYNEKINKLIKLK